MALDVSFKLIFILKNCNLVKSCSVYVNAFGDVTSSIRNIPLTELPTY